jgi:hypothetical protein
MEACLTKLSKAGIYHGISIEQYRGDLCAGPSMSRSLAKDLLFSCPAKAWWKSYLNPEYVPARKKEFDIGEAMHLITLEPSKMDDRIVQIGADDFKTKAAQQARDAAYAAGKVPLLPKHFDLIHDMHTALMRNPVAREAFRGGTPEVTIVAQDPQTGIWLKARADYLNSVSRGAIMIDLKSTTDANPIEFAKAVWEYSYFQQDPWYRMVYKLATGEDIVDFLFIAQEKTPPYLVSIDRLEFPDAEMGDRCNRRAIDLFAECIANNHWPDYAGRIHSVSMPPWARYRLADMEGAGELTSPPPSQKLLDFARKMQAPLQLEHQS